jgi:hypothetical protein
MIATTNIAARPQSLHLGQVCLPPTQEEIAQAFELPFWVELLLELDSMPWFCPCAFASDRSGCLLRLRLSRLRCRPRARARRRRHSSGRSERGPPSDDDGDGGSDPPPHRSDAALFLGRRP